MTGSLLLAHEPPQKRSCRKSLQPRTRQGPRDESPAIFLNEFKVLRALGLFQFKCKNERLNASDVLDSSARIRVKRCETYICDALQLDHRCSGTETCICRNGGKRLADYSS